MATLATMLCRALPAFRSQRILHIAAISRQQKLTPNFSRFSRIQQLSTAIIEGEPSADENLIRALEDEIDEAPKPIGIPIPDWFPFEIEEDPERSMAVLRRNFGGQRIRIYVDSKDSCFHGTGVLHKFYFRVFIFKPKGQSLVFKVDAGNGNFEIRWFWHLRNKHWPRIGEEESRLVHASYLRNKLTKTFGKYLEDMEICDKRTLEFLYEYMWDKTKKEDMVWLNKMKKFVES